MRGLLGFLFVVLLAVGCSNKTSNCAVKDSDVSGKYYGECLNGLAHGEGEAAGRDTYVGSFKSGYADGHGVYKWGKSSWEGQVFVGDFEKGEFVDGRMVRAGGGVEEGTFYRGSLNGFGSKFYSYKTSSSGEGGARTESVQKLLSRGIWYGGDLVFQCESLKSCDDKWSGAVLKIEEYLRANDLDRRVRWFVEVQLQNAKCKRDYYLKKESSKYLAQCMLKSKSPLGLIAAIQAAKGGELFYDLNEVKAGLAPVGELIVTAGVGSFMMGHVLLRSSFGDLSPVMVDISGAGGESGLFVIKNCQDANNPCGLVVSGKVNKQGPVLEMTATYIMTLAEMEALKGKTIPAQVEKSYGDLIDGDEVVSFILKPVN